MSGVAHLTRRFLGSLSRAEPDEAQITWARGWLADAEWHCWRTMQVQDRRHSLQVARRFVDLRPQASKAEGSQGWAW